MATVTVTMYRGRRAKNRSAGGPRHSRGAGGDSGEGTWRGPRLPAGGGTAMQAGRQAGGT